MTHPVERRRRMVDSARDLRGRMTRAEAVLWERLRDRRLHGLKFRRQHPVGPFVLDFCCATHRLVVELDGGIHDEMTEQDEERSRLLAAHGYRVMRFWNEEVFVDLEGVLRRIVAEAGEEEQ